ncbi:uncharacterized protein BX663DRAFT_491259 [Cokeromyces recurvatus]|uniref:uncharacterized protein n=1 Tax=Cokeromyces recurvatus TaxID=90255 RepID=UPI002220681D|nr:uncharacterized protein BX663DRAFT_491259 [Cokeromyces recurvatus]KAI7907549.1 hypothetical protein BX663DRAFT_491259 [Cokeromyces recurvatus]
MSVLLFLIFFFILHDNLNKQRHTQPSSTLLSLCRPIISIDTILWFPIPFIEYMLTIGIASKWILHPLSLSLILASY